MLFVWREHKVLSINRLISQLGRLLDLDSLSTDLNLSVLLDIENLVLPDLLRDPIRLIRRLQGYDLLTKIERTLYV